MFGQAPLLNATPYPSGPCIPRRAVVLTSRKTNHKMTTYKTKHYFIVIIFVVWHLVWTPSTPHRQQNNGLLTNHPCHGNQIGSVRVHSQSVVLRVPTSFVLHPERQINQSNRAEKSVLIISQPFKPEVAQC